MTTPSSNLTVSYAGRTLTTPAQLLAAGLIQPDALEEVRRIAREFAIAITAPMRSLIDPHDPNDPIAAQFVPSSEEMHISDGELTDPIGDAAHSPVPGIVHRYPDRVLLMPLKVCPVYCRFCFRRETVGPGSQGLDDAALDRAIEYIASKPAIWEVIVSGGDPLLLSARRLKQLMERLDAIPHLGVVRFHTRVPVVLPEIIRPALVQSLKTGKAVFVVLHTNHARELTKETRTACARLIDAGIPMLSQTVLLNGVNAEPETLKTLFRQLVAMRIKPYYLHHADLARGTRHFRTSIAAGQALVRSLRGSISGLCQPSYVLDIPGGHGKVPIGPDHLHRAGANMYDVIDCQGKHHRYVDDVTPSTMP